MHHEEVVPYEELQLTKKEQVSLMFDRIAFRYDLMNRLLSFGVDGLWRKQLRKSLAPFHPKQILDAATGTGDVALELLKLQPEHITGIDVSSQMIAAGLRKIKGRNAANKITLIVADSENIPAGDNKFDGVTVAFGVRNFEDLYKGLSEFYRVLKTGGRLAILEFSKPKPFPFKQLYYFYFTRICPALGKLITRDKQAYDYLHRSVLAFPEGTEFISILKSIGFEDIQCKPLTFGICSLYTARRP